jgi:two-component system nitrate/nitrite response regulator NarL
VTTATRVLIVDDHAIFRQGLKLLLQRDSQVTVIGEAPDADKALAIATKEQPDIILLDVDLEGFDALEILESLQAAAPATRIIILTGVRTPELQARALRLGAKGFVSKDQSADLVLRAIKKVHEGELWFDRGTVGAAVMRLLKGKTEQDATAATLTPRELDIVRLVGEGLRNDAIAKRLLISDKTVRNQLTVIFEKAGVHDRLHLAIYAYRHGLAKVPQ